jgi:hypothetical protein
VLCLQGPRHVFRCVPWFGWEKGKEKENQKEREPNESRDPEEEGERERERERDEKRKKVIEEEREAPQRKQGNVQGVRGAVVCAKCNVWRDRVRHASSSRGNREG